MELPTRVLDVQSRRADGMVRLLDTGAERARYATLSYCWGTTGNLKSTTTTVGLHRSGIKIDALPKTVRDAVAVTQHLGLQYLWVDALCIIQDDPQDWDREAQSMARVYANAYVNISALGAADTSQGCFMRRPPDRGAVPLEYHHDDGTCHQVFATIVTQTQMGSERRDLSGYPTSTRAWTLQERILARRTLHFGTEQMFFECAWGFRSEDGFVEPRYGRGATIPESLSQGEEFINGDMAGTHFYGFQGWTRLVTIYAARGLTKSSDKLPAFSGIAQRYEAMLKDEYIVGLWKSRLIEDLHWSSESWFIPPGYRAPSWSWMSIDGNIFMPDMKEKNMGQKCAIVLDYHLEFKGQNPYGELTGGWLKIEAPLAEVVDGRIFGFEVGQGGLSVYVEVPSEIFGRLRIFTLFLYITGDVAWTALLVTPVKVSGLRGGRCYRRVGKVTNVSGKKRCEIPDKAVCILV
jgi:Heterokaryon incompatibility protein (HET)